MRADVIVSLLLIAVSPLLYVQANAFPVGASTFPHLLLVVIVLLSLIQLVVSLVGLRSGAMADSTRKQLRLGPYAAFVAIAIYVLAIQTAGFFVASGVFLVAMMFYLGERRPATFALAISGILLFYWVLFVTFLHVPLPTGMLF